MLPSFHVLATGISPILGTPLPPVPIWRACPFSGRPDARPALAYRNGTFETVHDSFTVVIPDAPLQGVSDSDTPARRHCFDDPNDMAIHHPFKAISSTDTLTPTQAAPSPQSRVLHLVRLLYPACIQLVSSRRPLSITRAPAVLNTVG